ncbi:MAG: hypothetical protein KGP28_07905 [Bdellovibrionales bacterium]|nr:hypothetical protein [Bdellovibrionales bacterium]
MKYAHKILFLMALPALFFLESGALSHANGPGSGIETSNAYVDAMWLMREARDPSRSPSDKRAAAQRGLDFIRAQVGSQLPIKSLDELPAYFAAHPEMNSALTLDHSKGLGRVVTEFNLLLQDIRVGEKLKDCDTGKRSAGIKNGMSGHDPCQGNRLLKSNIYSGVGKSGDKIEYSSPLPTFVSGNVGEILAFSTMTNFFDEKNDGKDPFRPTLEQVKKANPQSKTDGEFATAAVLAEVRGHAYKQAITREIRNRMSLIYQYQKTSGGKSWDEMKGLIASSVESDCKHCTPAMMDEVQKSVQGALIRDIENQVLKKSEDPGAIVEKLCSGMKKNGFPFKGGPEEKEIKDRYQNRRTNTLKGIHDVKFDLQLLNQQETMELSEVQSKRKAILGKMVQEGGDGLLLLTQAMSELSGPYPQETKLKCDASSKTKDAALVTAAANEAIGKTKEYASKLNSILKPGRLDEESQKAELDELVKIAPGAVGEALNYSHPFAASMVCNSLSRLQREDNIQAFTDGAVMWGATVVGVVAIIATQGAAAPIVMAGVAASAVAGAGAAIYSWDQSGEAEKLAMEYRNAAIALGGNPDLLGLSQEEFYRYKEHRFNAVLSGAFSAVEFASLIATGAKLGKSMKEINQEIDRIAANPSEKGNWFKQNAKALAADAALNTAISSAANGYTTGDFTPDPAQIAMGMVIGAGVRRLGKPYTTEESVQVRDQMNAIKRDMKKQMGRDPTPDELFSAYQRVNLESVEIVASKPKTEVKPEIQVTDQNRAKVAGETIGRELTPAQGDALQRAHEVGRGQPGKAPGTDAAKGNYTMAQLREKTKILRDAGFSDAEASILLRRGLAGDDPYFRNSDAANWYEPGRAVSVLRSGGNAYTNAVIHSVNADGTLTVTFYENGAHLQKTVSPHILGYFAPVSSGHLELGQKVSIPGSSGIQNGRIVGVDGNGRVRVEVLVDGRSVTHEVSTSQVMDPVAEIPVTPKKEETKPDPKKSLMDRVKGVFGSSSKGTPKPEPRPLDPDKREWFSKKGQDYVSRRGDVVVEVNLESRELNRAVNQAVETIERVTGISAGTEVKDAASRKKIYDAWLKHVVPLFEDPKHGTGEYGNSRDQIISSGNGRADLGVLLQEKTAVCRELSVAGSVVFGEFGIPTTVQAGNVGTVSGKGGGHAWIRDDQGLIIDNNYTRRTQTWDQYQQMVGGAVYFNEIRPVEVGGGSQ